ncbi:hypothetical protein SDC9_07418 [bioreactor metagenome]|uniref:Phage tail sheath protein n=1 Tax=bioreactor metagenome TaxID=1076179 RepID=A0A644T4Z3_9ZZZZ|nr:hypothetical protein [Methanobrevibacter sp.]MEA4956874.1 hypothetical protein [Methanobrevibacter sp.]
MKGETIINMKETSGITPQNNYRNVVAILAPFKDNSFTFKSYKNMDLAISDQKTSVEEAVGYSYLLRMREKGFKTDIVLLNSTTGTGESVDYTLTNDKLSSLLTELEDARVNIIYIAYELTDAQQTIFKTFRDAQFAKMKAFGLNTIMVSTEAKHEALAATFAEGGIYEVITTREDESLITYSLGETGAIETARTAQLPENVSKTAMLLPNVTGKLTKEVYGEEIYQSIIDNGAVALKYRERVNQLIEIVNSNTPTGRDLKIERVYHLIVNEVGLMLESYKGQDNSITLTYPHLLTELGSIKKTYMDLGYITDLEFNIIKTGQNTAEISIILNEDDIIEKFDVNMTLIINEE